MYKQIKKKILGHSMEELYIHAGLPKNGSSAIQVFLAKNIKQLYAERVEYFELQSTEEAKKGRISSGNGALLSRWMLNENHEAYYSNGAVIYKRLFDLVKKSQMKTGLISSEFFANTPYVKLEMLKKDLEELGVTLKFLFYARRQDQHLMSAYMQRIKRHGETELPEAFISNSYRQILFLKYYDYAKSIENVLGEGNVLASIYETTKNHPKGLVGHFLQSILGKCPSWVSLDTLVNTSPSAIEIKFMLMANKFAPRMRFSDFVVEDSIRAGRSQKYKSHVLLREEVVSEILSFFAEQNQKFEQKYAQGKKFPQYESRDYTDLENFSFSPNEVLDIMSGFMVRFDKRLTRLENN